MLHTKRRDKADNEPVKRYVKGYGTHYVNCEDCNKECRLKAIWTNMHNISKFDIALLFLSTESLILKFPGNKIFPFFAPEV